MTDVLQSRRYKRRIQSNDLALVNWSAMAFR